MLRRKNVGDVVKFRLRSVLAFAALFYQPLLLCIGDYDDEAYDILQEIRRSTRRLGEYLHYKGKRVKVCTHLI